MYHSDGCNSLNFRIMLLSVRDAQKDRLKVTRPYLSITGTDECITVSVSHLVNVEMRVLCGDVSWRDGGPVKRQKAGARHEGRDTRCEALALECL